MNGSSTGMEGGVHDLKVLVASKGGTGERAKEKYREVGTPGE